MRFVPVILAGGKGERFWPLSRKDRPKQFLRLDGSGRSLLQATADRLLPLAGVYGGLSVYRVARFTEKPDREAAEAFLKTGRYYWNGGIFVFRAGVSLKELRQHAPEVVLPLLDHGVAAYAALPKTSIDYVLMEKTERAYAVPAAFGWDYLGDWMVLEQSFTINNKELICRVTC